MSGWGQIPGHVAAGRRVECITDWRGKQWTDVLGRLSTHSTVVFTVTQATSAVDPPTRGRPATHPVRINRPRPPRAPAKRLGGRATSTLSSRACPGLERAWPSQRCTWVKFAGPNPTQPNATHRWIKPMSVHLWAVFTNCLHLQRS